MANINNKVLVVMVVVLVSVGYLVATSFISASNDNETHSKDNNFEEINIRLHSLESVHKQFTELKESYKKEKDELVGMMKQLEEVKEMRKQLDEIKDMRKQIEDLKFLISSLPNNTAIENLKYLIASLPNNTGTTNNIPTTNTNTTNTNTTNINTTNINTTNNTTTDTTINNPSHIPITDDTTNKKEAKRLFIGILSAYDYEERRNVVRNTWIALPESKNWTYKFVMGESKDKAKRVAAEEEAAKYGDIVFNAELDTYRNLTYKVLHLAKYAVENYDFDYFLKTDDDSFVMVDRLLDMSQKFTKTKYYGGTRNNPYYPIRDPGSPWYMPADLYPPEQGPPLHVGEGYVMSRDAVEMLVDNQITNPKKELPILPLEDVNSAIVMGYNEVPATKIPEFLRADLRCPCEAGMVLAHGCDLKALQLKYDNIKRDGKPC